MNFKSIDPEKIRDLDAAKIVIRELLNVIECFQSQINELKEELQKLRDENNRLKGEQGKPKISKNKDNDKGNFSSEKERKTPGSWSKSKKNSELSPTREEKIEIDKSQLPDDVLDKGYEEVIIQDLKIEVDVIKFYRRKYYSPSTQETFLAPLPDGYDGQFGPGLKTYIILQYYGCNVSEAKIHEFLENVGIKISAGTLSKLVLDRNGIFKKEKDEIQKEGLKSTPWQNIDDTGTRVNGKNGYCHIICNPLFVSYSTKPRKDRLTVLDVLMGNPEERFYRTDSLAYTLLEGFKVPIKYVEKLKSAFPGEQTISEKEFQLKMTAYGIPEVYSARIFEACAISAYNFQTGYPIIELLICDDAPQFKSLTSKLSLCWVHEGRHYKKLTPCIDINRKLLDGFLDEFWKFYRKLIEFKTNPVASMREALIAEFEVLFTQKTGYADLDDRIKKTFEKKENLLMVLEHPEIPLHNNSAENSARDRVRKRDVSYGPRTEEGAESWDTFMSIAGTARKLGVSFFKYMYDRFSKAYKMLSLSEMISIKAKGALQH